MPFDDDYLLARVREERTRSIGFDNDSTLTTERDIALEYYQGEMRDMQVGENESSACSSDVSDAIETALPDLVEVFTTEEVAAFIPSNETDVAGADQETDVVNHVVLNDNDGFLIFNDMFRDALQMKVGVAMAQWEDPPKPEGEVFEGAPLDFMAAVQLCKQNGSKIDPKIEEIGEGQVSWTVYPPQPDGRVRIQVIPPEDFTVSSDTVRLKDSPYCAYRAYVRKEKLLADGYDSDLVDELEAQATPEGPIALQRSSAGEETAGFDASHGDAARVEVVYHFVRLYEDGKPVIYRVTTGNHEGVILDKTKVNRIPFAAVTPYAVTHRFYGYSLADKLIEIQKIKTALIRMLLNAGYFAQNGRMEVVESGMSAWTLRDLMDNRPGQHVRVKSEGTVTPIPNGTLPINAFDSLEYISTMGEQRSGIVRNAQGLNPDTLHDTASGAAQLISAAQKRIRYMARMFAETGVKDLYLLVHDLLRTHATKAMVTRIRGKFVATDPTKWASRDNMCVAVGVGAGGRDHDLAMLTQILNQQEKVVQSQGGPDGPLVTPQNVYATLIKFASRAGFKAPEMFWTDPSSLPPQPPKPNPEMARVQAEAQNNQQRLQLEQQKLQLDRQKTQAEMALLQAKQQAESQHKDADRQSSQSLEMAKLQLEQALAVFNAETRTALAQEELRIKYGTQADAVAQDTNLKGYIADQNAKLEAARIGMSDQHHQQKVLADAMANAHSEQMDLIGVKHVAGMKAVVDTHKTNVGALVQAHTAKLAADQPAPAPAS